MPPKIKQNDCIACGTCASICCMNVFGPVQKGTVPVVRYPDECWHCRACVMDCPTHAIEMRYPLPYQILFRTVPGLKEVNP